MFQPTYCPNQSCPSELRKEPFRYQKRGSYQRACDGKRVRRFRCLACERGFSTQTFKSNYRYRKPFLHNLLLQAFVAKVTRRQAAKFFGVNRKTIERRFVRMAEVCAAFHRAKLTDCRARGGIHGVFQLDELETFEHHRKLRPVTMAVLIERHSYFTVATRAGELPARRPLKPREKRRLKELETALGKRKSASRACVRSCFESLEQILKPDLPLVLQSDQKRTYPSECRRAIGNRTFIHRTTSSRNLRDYHNLIFPINHTLAMMRDGMSCLVRRSWAAAKTIRGLERHAAIWVAYRNYVRGITNKTGTTPAQEAGICREPYRMKDMARWRWPDRNPI